MKLIIEMNVYEANRTMATGTLQALCKDVQESEQEARKVPKPDKGEESKTERAVEPTAPTAKETEKAEGVKAGSKTGETSIEINEEAPTFTLEEVRSKLAALSQSGKQAQVKALIAKFGASKLTEVPKEKYAELMKEAEVI